MILAIIITVLAVAFLFWFVIRTPENLQEWYGVPVVIFAIVLVVVIWLFATGIF